MSDKVEYRLPAPVLDEQHYSFAIVAELQRIRIALEKLAGVGEAQAAGETELREAKAKPKRGE